MAGTFTAKSIADGQVAVTQTALYTVPASSTAYIKQITLYNTNITTQYVVLRITRSGGTSRRFRRIMLGNHESCFLLDQAETIELSAGDSIDAETTTASAVDYVVLGVVET